jgi:hypothetical protein
MKALTTNQRALLEALADGAFYSVPELFALDRVPENRSRPGVHETAASLAKKGYVDRSRHHGRVFLQITAAGREWIEYVDSVPDLEGSIMMRSISFRVYSVPATPQDRAVLTAVDKTWAKIQEQWAAHWDTTPPHPVPDVTFDLTPGRSSSCTSVGWDLRPVVELNLQPDGKVMSGADLLAYLLHQAAHSVVASGSAQEGRFHTAAYRDAAKALGLDAARDSYGSYGTTTLATGTRTRYKTEVATLDRTLAKWTPGEVARGDRGSRNGVVLECSCTPETLPDAASWPRKIRLRGNPDTINVNGIRCEFCGQEFSPAETSPASS